MIRCFSVLLLVAVLLVPAAAKDKAAGGYETAFAQWSDFSGWTGSGVSVGTEVRFDGATAADGADPYAAGGYCNYWGTCGNYYNAGTFKVGEAVSPVHAAPFNFREAIVSWNADTPSGSWVETLIRVELSGSRWSKWYNLGIWAKDYSTIQRHFVRLQGDGDGSVAIDTLVVSSAEPVSAYQLKVRLFQATGSSAVPAVNFLSLSMSGTPQAPTALAPGNPALWNTLLDVPECSQMIYPDGGNVWCSPSSTSMVLGYWQKLQTGSTGPCEPRVRAAVDGVYDWTYDGHGNWPFNTAYAAAVGADYYAAGLEAKVARFSSMAEIEPWVNQGVPVVISFAFKKLTNASIKSSDGHLAVIVGFDSQGNPIVNDPAAPSNEEVQRTYLRSELESVWLEHSGGTVYLIYPTDWTVPTL